MAWKKEEKEEAPERKPQGKGRIAQSACSPCIDEYGRPSFLVDKEALQHVD